MSRNAPLKEQSVAWQLKDCCEGDYLRSRLSSLFFVPFAFVGYNRLSIYGFSNGVLTFRGPFFAAPVSWNRFECIIKVYTKQGRPGGILENQYTRKKFKYTQNYTQIHFIPEIQRRRYTEYPYLSCNIPYTRLKKPLYTVYPKTLADPDKEYCRSEPPCF